MIRYGYTRQLEPPAPFVHVSLRCESAGTSVLDLPAQVDSAADRSVIPGCPVAHLGLECVDELQVAGLGSEIVTAFAYRVELTIRGLSPVVAVVIAHDGEPYVLLGRDILNRYRVVLDAPGLALEIG